MAIIRREEHHIDTNMTGQGFGIELTSKAFETLTSNLYTRKPEAVARETLCNADDAHKERDRMYPITVSGYYSSVYQPEARAAYLESIHEERKYFAPRGTPYIVHAPSNIEPYFSVEDRGVGLTVDQILGKEQTTERIDEETGERYSIPVIDGEGHPVRGGGMYTTLFASTKELTNDQIGAFGLGAKAGFSISDTFTVVSRVGGYEHTYIMYMDAERKPNVTWVTKDPETGKPAGVPTDKPNGVMVQIPVEPEMCHRMNRAIEFTLSTFESEPIIENMYECKKIDRSNRTGNTFIQLKGGRNNFPTHYAVQGGVAYPIETNSLEDSNGDHPMKKLLQSVKYDSYTFFEIGELNVPPSREYLTYDKFTLESLSSAVSGIVEGLDQIVHEDCVMKLKEIKTFSMHSIWQVWKQLNSTWDNDLTRERWDKARREVVGGSYSEVKFGKEMYINMPIVERAEKDVLDNDILRKIPKYDIQLYVQDYKGNIKHSVSDPKRMAMKDLDNSVFLAVGNCRNYIRKARHVLDTMCNSSVNKIYFVREHTAAYFKGVEGGKGKSLIEDLHTTFEGQVEVCNLPDVELPKTEYSANISSGISRYAGGVSRSANSWYKVTPKELANMLSEDLKYVYVDVTGFDPNDCSMSRVQQVQRTMNSFNGDLDALGYGENIIAVRKSAHRVLKEHGHRFVTIEEISTILIEKVISDPKFRRFAQLKTFDHEVYNSDIFGTMALTAPMRNEDIGMYRQFAQKRDSCRRVHYSVRYDIEIGELECSKLWAEPENSFMSTYSILENLGDKVLRESYPWIFRMVDFWKPKVDEFRKEYPMTCSAIRRSDVGVHNMSNRKELLEKFEIECVLKNVGYEFGILIDKVEVPEVHARSGKGKHPSKNSHVADIVNNTYRNIQERNEPKE